jgi:hypothetical protein
MVIEMVAGNEEEFERYLKSLNKCRICAHPRIAHPGVGKWCLDVTLTATGNTKMCSCREYVPNENLEFLEYKYSKKKYKKGK